MNSDTALVVYAFINIFSIYCVHSLHTFMYVCRGALIIIFIHALTLTCFVCVAACLLKKSEMVGKNNIECVGHVVVRKILTKIYFIYKINIYDPVLDLILLHGWCTFVN